MNCLPGTFASLDDAYSAVIRMILKEGELVSPRESATTEVRAVGFSIADPLLRYISLPSRKWNFGYALGEYAWHIRGSDRLSEIIPYSSRWKDASDDGETINSSCYGAKIFLARGATVSQWNAVRQLLLSDRDSRRAILVFSDPINDSSLHVRDMSCATTLQLLIRHGKLEAIACMRSNDAIYGLPYDVFLFTMLQEMMAVELNVGLGAYSHFVGSMHIYDSNRAWAERIDGDRPALSQPMPAMTSTIGKQTFLESEETIRLKGVANMGPPATAYWNELTSVLLARHHSSNRVAVKTPLRQLYTDLLALAQQSSLAR